MSSPEKPKDLDFKESLLPQPSGEGKKRRRRSTSSLPSRAKKFKPDPMEVKRPVSAPPSSVGNEFDSELDEGVQYIEEYKEEVMPHLNDEMPHREVDFSDNVQWTPGMIYDVDIMPEDMESISSNETYTDDDEGNSDSDP